MPRGARVRADLAVEAPDRSRRPRPCRRARASAAAGAAASTSIAARTESGIRVVGVVDDGGARVPYAAPRAGRRPGETPRARARSLRAARRSRAPRPPPRARSHVVPARRGEPHATHRPPASRTRSPRRRRSIASRRRIAAGCVEREVDDAHARRARAPRRATRRRDGSSALTTAMPPAGSARTSAACSAATSATLRMNSWCSRCALLMSATVGCAIAASSAVSPGWFMPSSIAGRRDAPSRRPSSVSGRPIALLRLPSRREHARGAEVRAQDRRQHFLDRRLAVAADDDDDRKREARAPVRRERAERGERIRHGDEIARQRVRRGRAATSAAAAPRSLRGADEVVAVEALALERDEEIARRERARVGGDAREAHVRRRACGRRPRARRSPCPSCAALHRCASASAAATAASENGGRTPFALLVVLVALAGDEHDVAGAARSRCAARIAAPRSSSTAKLRPARGANARRRSRAAIAAGSSRRGLSLVTTTRSASVRGDAAHLRALAGIAVAAAAEHADELAAFGRPRAATPSAPSRARRACARNRRRRAAAHPPPSRCIRPGGGVHARERRERRGEPMPLASSTPSTPSTFDALNVPDEPRRDVAAAPGRRDRQARCPACVVATRVAAMSALAEAVGQHVLSARARRVGERCGRTDRRR